MAGTSRDRAAYFSRAAMGQRLAGFIYGTIVVLAVVVAAAQAYPDDAARIAALVGVTSVVFWLAHVYAHGVAESVADDQRFSLTRLRRIAQREASIVEAALPSFIALLLGAFGLLSTKAAIWLAIALGLAGSRRAGDRLRACRGPGSHGDSGCRHREPGPGSRLVGLKLLVTH